uniref:Asparagine synthetase domain-containing protein n=1 Tax=Globodera pallida TaxID=36090 RepID=A0A183BY50_GLOPA
MCEERIRSAVGTTGEVLVLVSGGVDSTVCAALCTKAYILEGVMLSLQDIVLKRSATSAIAPGRFTGRSSGDMFLRCKDMAIQKIESAASELANSCAGVIKTHHNDSVLDRLVEPLQCSQQRIKYIVEAFDDRFNAIFFPTSPMVCRATGVPIRMLRKHFAAAPTGRPHCVLKRHIFYYHHPDLGNSTTVRNIR